MNAQILIGFFEHLSNAEGFGKAKEYPPGKNDV